MVLLSTCLWNDQKATQMGREPRDAWPKACTPDCAAALEFVSIPFQLDELGKVTQPLGLGFVIC